MDTKNIKGAATNVAGTLGGVIIGGMLVKKVPNLMLSALLLAGGTYAAANTSGTTKGLATGVAIAGGMGVVKKVAEKNETLNNLIPSLGEVMEIDGEFYDLQGFEGSEIVSDQFGNQYVTVEGVGEVPLDEYMADQEGFENGEYEVVEGVGDLDEMV